MIYQLQSEIKKVLEKGFETPYFSKPGGEDELPSKLNFHYGKLIPKQKGKYTENDFPYCVLNIVDGEDNSNDKSIIKSYITFGSYSGSKNNNKESYENGQHEIQNITERARLTLLKNQWLDDQYNLKKINWQIGDENGLHNHPFYQSHLLAIWEVPLIQTEQSNEIQEYYA